MKDRTMLQKQYFYEALMQNVTSLQLCSPESRSCDTPARQTQQEMKLCDFRFGCSVYMSHLLEVLHSFEVESLRLHALRVDVTQLRASHLLLLLPLLQLQITQHPS